MSLSSQMKNLPPQKQRSLLKLLEVEEEERRRQQAAIAEIWTPQPGPQTEAFNSDADVIGYGGSAGGGKTDVLLGLAAIKHRRSIIFRRVFPNARGIIERSRELFSSHFGFNEAIHLWRLGVGR